MGRFRHRFRVREAVVLVFFNHVKPSARKGAKLLSKDNVYSRFCFQFSKLLIDSTLERHHRFWCTLSRRHNTRCSTRERVVTAKDALCWLTRSRGKIAFFGRNEAWVDPTAATTPVKKITQEPRYGRSV